MHSNVLLTPQTNTISFHYQFSKVPVLVWLKNKKKIVNIMCQTTRKVLGVPAFNKNNQLAPANLL